jgi:CrcB protein
MNDSLRGKTPPKTRWTDPLFRLTRHKMLLVMLGGALGTLLRYEIGEWVKTQTWAQGGFPYATFFINITGSFILGAAAIIMFERLPPEYTTLYALVGVGFCGGYTTFSSFELETYNLIRDGSWRLALVYVVGSVIAGFISVVLAVMLVRLVLPGK